MQPFCRFALVFRGLGGDTKEMFDTVALQIGVVIAKGAGLRRAAAGTGNLVPAIGPAGMSALLKFLICLLNTNPAWPISCLTLYRSCRG